MRVVQNDAKTKVGHRGTMADVGQLRRRNALQLDLLMVGQRRCCDLYDRTFDRVRESLKLAWKLILR